MTPEQTSKECISGQKMQTRSCGGPHVGQSQWAEQGWGVCREPCSPGSPKQCLKLMMVITKEPVVRMSREMELQHRNISQPCSQGEPMPVDHVTLLCSCESSSSLGAITSVHNVSWEPVFLIYPASTLQVLGCIFNSKGLTNSGLFSAACQPQCLQRPQRLASLTKGSVCLPQKSLTSTLRASVSVSYKGHFCSDKRSSAASCKSI